ncbi:lysis system i-spanin subunit Rz [Shigella boydii]|uniref:lysis system i-spanin subunit Rz n=1 Tax=Shigella boydii TaxID=621 RepID=UPI0025415542|nr:lysis system i-spanin subunit Rz [Shigella boydii]
MTLRQRQNAALDAKYTKELANAKAESEKLRADLASGRRRLQLHAVCMPAATRDTTPPAQLMQPPPDLLRTLNGIISISEPKRKPSLHK